MQEQQTQQAELLQEQIQELIKVGVGGKYKDNTDYTAKITEELELEHRMVRGGVDRYVKQVTNAAAKGQESTTLYGLVYQQKYITQLSNMLNQAISEMQQGTSGRHEIALKLLPQCLSRLAFNEQTYIDSPNNWDAVSLIVLKNIINGISHRQTLNRLSIVVGSALEYEARFTYFRDKDKITFDKISKRLHSGKDVPMGKSKYLYKRNVFVYYMKKKNYVWNRWNKIDKVHLGTKMISYLEQLGLVKTVNRRIGANKTIIYVEATPRTLKEIKDFNGINEALSPEYMPMIMPPREWSYNPFVGGYYAKKYNQENKPEEIVQSLKKGDK